MQMRWSLIIGAVYLLGLSLVPCSDTFNRCEERVPVAENAPYEEHSHSNDADDHCSPFCYCACCSISLNLYHFNSFTVQEPLSLSYLEEKVIWPYSDFRSSYFGSIWQPPKINA